MLNEQDIFVSGELIFHWLNTILEISESEMLFTLGRLELVILRSREGLSVDISVRQDV